MRSALATGALALAAALLCFAAAPDARAEDLAEAKAAGWLGERPDGYLGVVSPSAPPAAVQLAGEINAKRKLKYAQIAQENGAAVDSVAALMGAKQIARAPAGEYVMGADERWQKK